MLLRFRTHRYDDPMESMMKLRQTTIVEEYKCQFEALANRLKGLDESYKLSCFLSGLKDEVRVMVRMLNLNSIHLAYGLARMQEENLLVSRRTFKLATTGAHFQTNSPQPAGAGAKPNVTV